MLTGQIIDLETILPEYETISFRAHTDGIKYKVEMFIPSAATLLVVNNSKLFQDVFRNNGIEATRQAMESVLRISEIIFKRSHSFMGAEWIEKNISMSTLMIIISKILMSVYKYFDQKRDGESGESKGEITGMEIAPIMSLVMNVYSLTPEYILYKMSYPQLVMAYNEAVAIKTGKRAQAPIPEETEEEIKAKFKKVDGRWV